MPEYINVYRLNDSGIYAAYQFVNMDPYRVELLNLLLRRKYVARKGHA